MTCELPKKQTALQLVGPDEMIINSEKDVIEPGPFQILGKIEAVGLCFSDLKLLKQFSAHARKTKIISGIEEAVLDEVPSYVPGEKPAVPGHEAVVRICAVGDKVDCVRLNHRYLVQTDYRWLPTENSNASFGYNFSSDGMMLDGSYSINRIFKTTNSRYRHVGVQLTGLDFFQDRFHIIQCRTAGADKV